jgi:hypothetical protein
MPEPAPGNPAGNRPGAACKALHKMKEEVKGGSI